MLEFQESETERGAGVAGVVADGVTVNAKIISWLVACTLIFIVELITGAVNRPEKSTTPAVADYSTAMFAVLLTTALNCWVFPETMVVFEGDAEMLTLLAPRWVSPPPHSTRKIGPEDIR